jgi:hypothetical protein
MPATAKNLTIEQGATFSQTLNLGASTWDGQTATAKLYDRFNGVLIATFTCSAITAQNVTISLTAAQTKALIVPAWVRNTERKFTYGYYELVAQNGAVISRLFEGVVLLSRAVDA